MVGIALPYVLLLIHGDDHRSLSIFRCPSRIPRHEFATELHCSRLKRSWSDFIAACSFPSLHGFEDWKTLAAVMVFFSPKCIKCVSNEVARF